jgi:hypothetical protein
MVINPLKPGTVLPEHKQIELAELFVKIATRAVEEKHLNTTTNSEHINTQQ